MGFIPDWAPLDLQWLHILWSAAFVCISCAVWWVLTANTFRKWKWPQKDTRHLMIYWIISGVVGGRLIILMEHLEFFISQPHLVFNFYSYGISVFGMLCGSAAFLFLSQKKYPFSLLHAEDVMVSNLPLTLAVFSFSASINSPSVIGQWVRFFYGLGTLLLWLVIRYGIRKSNYRHFGDLVWITILLIGVLQMICMLSIKFIFHMPQDILPEMINSIMLMQIGILGRSNWYSKHRNYIQKEKAVLFDLDGTLADSQPLVFETFRQVFANRLPDYKLSEDELYSFFGPTLEVTFSKYFPKEEVEDVIEEYQRINLSLHDEMIKPMPHAAEVLKELQEQGYKVGIVSNKRTPVVMRGLKACGLEDYCSLVMGKEDQPHPKPEPDGLIEAARRLGVNQDEILYVGDNAADIEAAKNMGSASVGFSIDERQRQALRKAAPVWNIIDLREILDIVKEDQEWIDKSIW